jgi:BON domain
MLHKEVVPDKVLLKRVNQRLMRAGLGAGCSVRVSVRNGQVTLAGTIQRDLQRRPTLRAASGIAGVRQVVDQLKVEAKKARVAPKKAQVEAKPLVGETKEVDEETEERPESNEPS